MSPSTAPRLDIAGLGVANPIATILSAGMMLRMSFDLAEEADAIEAAIDTVLAEGYRTKDIAAGMQPGRGNNGNDTADYPCDLGVRNRNPVLLRKKRFNNSLISGTIVY